MSKRFGLILSMVLSLLPSLALAQDSELLTRLYGTMSESCTELEYTYTVELSGTKNTGNGSLALQGHMWALSGNGLDIYCDSASVWIIDAVSKEVVIEPVVTEINTFSNPAVIFAHLQDLFTVRSSVPSADGKAVTYILRPKSSGDVEYVNLEILSSATSIRSCEVALTDGSLIKIKVGSMKPTPLRTLSDFRPKTAFDSSWIVTDMR